MTSSELEDQIGRLGLAVESLATSVLALDEESFLMELNEWSPRDMLAHLVGWNRHVIEGSRQIQRGELPFYDIDPGMDYSNVNAALVRQYDSTDRRALVDQFRTTAGELEDYLAMLDAAVWSRDFGVRHDAAIVTIRGTVDELIEDYDHHRKQIDGWNKTR